MARKTVTWGWLVIRPGGVDEYASKADAEADANGGVVVHASVAAAAPDLLAFAEDIYGPLAMGRPLSSFDADKIMDRARALIARATGGAR